MLKKFKSNKAKVLSSTAVIIFGCFIAQVSAVSASTEKAVTKPGLASVCVSPARAKARAAQDDRCTDKNTGTIRESLPAKNTTTSSPNTQSLPAKTTVTSSPNKQSLPAKTMDTSSPKDQPLPGEATGSVKAVTVNGTAPTSTTTPASANAGSSSAETVSTAPTKKTVKNVITAKTPSTLKQPVTVSTSPTLPSNSITSSVTTTTVASVTKTTVVSVTTPTVFSRVAGSFAGFLGGSCSDGSSIPYYWGSNGIASAGSCSSTVSTGPVSAGRDQATTTTTIAPVTPNTPATPTGVGGNQQVTVTVSAGSGSSTEGTPTSYTVTVSTTSGGTYTTGCTITGAAGACIITGLTNGTTYFFKATATNSAGTSGLSSASSAVTPAAVPGAPTIGTATVASATSVTVACTAPASNGGATITTYTATSSPGGITGTLTSATCSSAITVTGLTTGTAYTFTVTATNSAGTSVASSASNSVTPSITCATGGTCIVGDTGPLGGKVYYVASSTFTCGSTMSSTCRYLEWDTTSFTTTPTATTYWCNNLYTGGSSVPSISGTSTAIGSGLQNTRLMRAGCTSGIANNESLTSAQFASGWHIPSYLELDTLRNARSTAIGYPTSQNGEWYTSSQTGSTLNGRSEWFDSGGTTDSKSNAIPSLRVSAFNSTS